LPHQAHSTISASPRITVIAAVARNGVIGRNNALPWHLPEDLRRFKALTMGHPLVMGRKTFESLSRPLPGRTHVVLSRIPGLAIPGCQTADSLPFALRLAAASVGGDEVFIIGGAEVFREALTVADVLQMTEIRRDFAGDAFFPPLLTSDWQESARESHRAAAGFDFDFVTYRRKQRH